MNTKLSDSDVVELEVVVVATHDAADGIRAFDFARVDGEPMPPWNPGAHIDLLLTPGLERQYSLCGDPNQLETWRVAVLREPESRGGSEWVHERLAEGDKLRIRGPRNNFPLVEASEYIFIAGGIGITPLLPMIAECEAKGRPWTLTYGGRSPSSMGFTHIESEYDGKVTLWPQDSRGLIDLAALLNTPRDGAAVYCCGPGVLLDAVEKSCEHWPDGSLHLERFRPKAGALDGVSRSFEIELDQTGLVLTVGENESIVDVLDKAGVEVPTSCREGTCGTCETVVLDGIPDHRDSFLNDFERDSNEVMMVCCSRAKCDRLVLDL
ncbi:ferredoxin [Rhodococcoides trifolii]|uniref:Ferredoxin n=1 Tax=Rhodococcoides trifolii TaxID=908250 RepID=A0A917CZ61_9NOCA|nr:PDR/VanB family oxidoreductase [Rhodococcus trifolii]GGG03368.1 ferredoxin [Rhodococcus trifolii]